MRLALIIVGVALALPTLPVLVELALFVFANLFLRARRERAKGGEGAPPLRSLAVLIPAHDEEKCVARCVGSVLASERGPYRVEAVVIADNCSDGTAREASGAGARVLERRDESVRGKGAAINFAVGQLMGEDIDAFIVVDADTVVPADFCRVMGDAFASGKDAIQCAYLALNVDAAPKVGLMNLALLSANVLRPRGRDLLGFSAGILGNGFGLTKRLLREVPYRANSITEDLEYHLRLIEGGYRVRFVPQATVLADFPVSKEGSETQRARWEGGRFMIARQFSGRLLGRVLAGKGAFLEPLLDLLSLPLSYEVVLLLALALLPVAGFRAYGLCALALILLHVLVAVALYGQRRDWKALLQVPSYLLWKIVKLPSILRASRADSAWVRTKRD